MEENNENKQTAVMFFSGLKFSCIILKSLNYILNEKIPAIW